MMYVLVCVCVCMCVYIYIHTYTNKWRLWVFNVPSYPRMIICSEVKPVSVDCALHFPFRRTNETSGLGTSVCGAVLFECRRTHLVDFSSRTFIIM
jgi:hypothetical protein